MMTRDGRAAELSAAGLPTLYIDFDGTLHESARVYGVWDVKKTYIHLYEDHQIHMDCYDDPLENRDGLSALQLATIGYAKHFSQHGQYQMENQGVQFDNKLFGLYRTTVGYDEVGGDFFENIP